MPTQRIGQAATCQNAMDNNDVEPEYKPSGASIIDDHGPTHPRLTSPTTTKSAQLMVNVIRRNPSSCCGSGSSVSGLRKGSTTSASSSSVSAASFTVGAGVCDSIERALYTMRFNRCHSGKFC